MFKMSIIIPVMNSEKTIEKTIKSIIPQKDDRVEVVIIDGGSTDGTEHVIEKYKKYVDFYLSEADKGYADALNKGIKNSTCDYYMMLAADDILLPNSIDLIEKSIKADTQVWCGAVIEYDKLGYRYTISNPDLNELFKYCSLKHPASVFLKKRVLEVGGYNCEYKCAADRELFLRLYQRESVFQMEDIAITLFAMDGMSNRLFQLAMEEDYAISLKYGISEEVAKKNRCEVEKEKQKYYRFWILKMTLKKMELLPYAFKLIGRNRECLTRKELKEYARFN